MNLDEIEVREYEAKWLDEPDEGSFIATIAILKTKEQSVALDQLQEDDCDEFYKFDQDIFHYSHAYLGETIEDLYKERNGTDFILIGETD